MSRANLANLGVGAIIATAATVLGASFWQAFVVLVAVPTILELNEIGRGR